MKPGDVRLVAWIDEALPGMNVRPAAPQKRHLALVVANLRYGFREAPEPDENTRYDFTKRVNVFRDTTDVGDKPEPDNSSTPEP